MDSPLRVTIPRAAIRQGGRNPLLPPSPPGGEVESVPADVILGPAKGRQYATAARSIPRPAHANAEPVSVRRHGRGGSLRPPSPRAGSYDQGRGIPPSVIAERIRAGPSRVRFAGLRPPLTERDRPAVRALEAGRCGRPLMTYGP
jgi:hypothetical protein